MIDAQTVEAIKSRAEIKDVVEDYVQLQRKGANYWGLCPFHNDRHPSFSVSPSKNFCHCFVCGEGGSPINFIMKKENVTYYEALKILANKYHIPIQERELTAEEKRKKDERESMLRANEWLNKVLVKNLHESPEGQATALPYLMQARRFRQDVIAKFQLGYALQETQGYTSLAEKSGVNTDILKKTGASVPCASGTLTDRFASRVTLPIHSLTGQVVGFSSIPPRPDAPLEYMETPENFVYQQRYHLYGLFFAKSAIQKEKKCYLAENFCDVIGMHQAGLENTVSLCGNLLQEEQGRLLARVTPSVGGAGFEEKKVTLIFNRDNFRTLYANALQLLKQGLSITVVQLPPATTAEGITQSHSGDEVKAYLNANEQDFVVYFANLYKPSIANPAMKDKAILGLATTISAIPNGTSRSVYQQECAKLLCIDERILAQAVAGQLEKKEQPPYERN